MKVVVYGNGVMGQKVQHIINRSHDFELVGIISPLEENDPALKRYQSLNEVEEKFEGLIDFSHPNNLKDILAYLEKHDIYTVIATTGLKEDDLKNLYQLSETRTIFQDYNTSYGIAMLNQIVKYASKELFDHDYDIEIIEAHHHRKVDAPSGTAKVLLNTIQSELDVYPIYNRESNHVSRNRKEVGISSIRAGTIFGEHTILYGGEDEIIEIKHTALSRDIFAKGAIEALRQLKQKDNGLYHLDTLYS